MEVKLILISAFLWVQVCLGDDTKLIFHPTGIAFEFPKPESSAVKKLVTEASGLAKSIDKKVKNIKAGKLDYEKAYLQMKKELDKFDAKLDKFSKSKDVPALEKLKEFTNKIFEFLEGLKCYVNKCEDDHDTVGQAENSGSDE